jgi:hypothetical protein
MATWVVTCSYGWTRQFSRCWAAESAGEAAPEARRVRHRATVTIEERRLGTDA